MWILLTISVLLVIGCIAFGIFSFARSRTLQKSIAAGPGNQTSDIQAAFIKESIPVMKKQVVVNLKSKLKSIEDKSLLSTHHLSELKKRIEALESGGKLNQADDEGNWSDSGEDWEKLYYEARREKQSLEDNLNAIKVSLQENMEKLRELKKQQGEMKSDVESGLNEMQSLQNFIIELHGKIKGGRERENELAQQLADEQLRSSGYDVIRKENNELHSEIGMLTDRIGEITANNISMEEKIKNLTELGSTLEIAEYKMRAMKKHY